MTAGRGFSGHAYCLSGTVHPEKYFIAARAQLGELHAASVDEHEVTHRLTLHEEEFIAREGYGLGA